MILRPNHRPQVAAPDLEQTRQILHARRLAERTLVRLACNAPQPKDLQQLRDLVERERQCLDRGERGPAIRLSGEFHLQLAVMAGNAPLMQFLGSLVPLTSLALARHEIRSRRHCAWQEHLAIIDAVEGRNVNEAVRLMDEHLDHLEQNCCWPQARVRHSRAASKPARIFSSGSSSAMNTITLSRASSGAHSVSQSKPYNLSTPWNTNRRGSPAMFSTPL